MAAAPERIYWDSCVWISLIAKVAGRVDNCEAIIARAQKGEVEIWTSSLTLAEVYKIPSAPGLSADALAAQDKAFEDFLQNDFVVEVQLDHETAVVARRLLRAHAAIKKPADGVHLATAVLNNVSEMHTYDGENLLKLDGLVARRDGSPLKICEPPQPAQPQLFSSAANALPSPPVPPDAGSW